MCTYKIGGLATLVEFDTEIDIQSNFQIKAQN